jgi:ABC-type branched-subunit amino acid transport system substrate-binding protein
MPYAGIEKFQDADVDVVPQLTRLKEAGADVLFLVANVAPSSQVVKSLDRMGWNVPIVSHWGRRAGASASSQGQAAAGPLHPDVQLLRQAVAEGRKRACGAEEEISGNQESR